MTLPRNWAITASTHWTPSSYTATSGFKNTTTTLTDSGSYWGTPGYGGDSHEHDDLTSETFASHSMSEHPTSAGALLDSDENHSSSSHTGTTSLAAHSWDDQVPLDSYTSSHPTYNDYVIDYSILGGDTGHTVIQAGSVTSSSVNPNSQSTVLEDYQAPIDLSGLSFEAFKTSMETKILLSPVHQLVIPPPPEAAWYAPWNNPDFWWNVAAFAANPIGHTEAAVVNFLSSQLEHLSQIAYDAGYDNLGLVLDVSAGVGHLGAGFLEGDAVLVQLLHGAVDYGEKYAAAGGGIAMSVLAGAGSVIGVNALIQGVTGTDLLTGEHLSNADAQANFFNGAGALMLTFAGGMSIMGVDVCLDGCFVAGTQVALHEAEKNTDCSNGLHTLMNLTGQSAAAIAANRYLTQNVELLLKDDYILSQDENDPDGPLVPRRVKEVYIRKEITPSLGLPVTLEETKAVLVRFVVIEPSRPHDRIGQSTGAEESLGTTLPIVDFGRAVVTACAIADADGSHQSNTSGAGT